MVLALVWVARKRIYSQHKISWIDLGELIFGSFMMEVGELDKSLLFVSRGKFCSLLL